MVFYDRTTMTRLRLMKIEALSSSAIHASKRDGLLVPVTLGVLLSCGTANAVSGKGKVAAQDGKVGVSTPAGKAVPAQAAKGQGQQSGAVVAAARAEAVEVSGQSHTAAQKLNLGKSVENDIATVYRLTQKDIQAQATSSSIDLFRNVPGVYVEDYGNGGIAQGFGMRGWSGNSNGNYVAAYIDGYQRNMYSGAQSNGYNDLNVLIPEIIGDINVIKGPFDTRYGGMLAVGGSVVIHTADFYRTGFSQRFGSFGESRSLLSYGYDGGRLKSYVVFEGGRDAGYRDNAAQDKVNLFSKTTYFITPEDKLSFSAQIYNANYGQPGYIPISVARVNPKAAMNMEDRGDKTQETFNFNFTHTHGNFQLDANLFVDNVYLYRSITRGYYPASVPRAEQNASIDSRTTVGAGVDPYWKFKLPLGMQLDLRAGALVHVDMAKAWNYPALNNQAIPAPQAYFGSINYFNKADFTEINPSLYLDVGFKPVKWMKISAGFRYDSFIFSDNVLSWVKPNNLLRQYITDWAGHISPKLGIAFYPATGLTLYGNMGEAVQAPNAVLQLNLNPSLKTSPMRSYEGGLAYDNTKLGFHFGADVYTTNASSEIGTSTTTGALENIGSSLRVGEDFDARLFLIRNSHIELDVAANYSRVRARLTGNSWGYVQFVPDEQKDYQINVSAPVHFWGDPNERLAFNFAHQFIGETKLSTDGRQSSSPYQRIQGKLTYSNPTRHNLSLYLSAIAFPTDRFSEINYYAAGVRYVGVEPRFRIQGGANISF